jgi:triphosphatase
MTATAKAQSSGLRDNDSLDDAAFKLLTNCRDHLIANFPAAHEGVDPEGVHQMRIGLRRLRTAITILRRDIPGSALRALSLDAKALARTLGPVRNWDVFTTETLPAIQSNALPDVDLGLLRDAAGPFRQQWHGRLREALPENNRFLASLGGAIECRCWGDANGEARSALAEPASTVADRALARLRRKARRQGRHFRQLPPEGRHELRLTLKNLRYAAEFFSPLYPGRRAEKYLDRLSRLQDALGADNDARVTGALLLEIEAGTSDPKLHRAIGAVIGWQGHRQSSASKLLRRRWREFRKARPFWTT